MVPFLETVSSIHQEKILLMKLTVTYSLEKDTQNHVNTVFKFAFLSHGREDIQNKLLSKLPPQLQELISTAKDEDEAHARILKFLTELNKKQPEILDNATNSLTSHWSNTGDAVIKSLEYFYQRLFPFMEITVYLTMIPISPYSYQEKYMFIYAPAAAMGQVSAILHELNHFMFYYYYPDLKNKLGQEKYELLKESLTFFTNPNQTGKPNEKDLRDLYASNQWKNIDEIINRGVELLESH